MNYCMRDSGGFEGNGQTLRLLARLEAFSKADGANLSRRTLLGVLKYPAAYSKLLNPELAPRMRSGYSQLSAIDVAASAPPKCYLDSEREVVDWVLECLSNTDRENFVAWQARQGRHGRTLHKSLDCSIMDVADDIAYGVHDLEDAVALRLVTPERFRQELTREHAESFVAAIRSKYPGESADPYEAMVSALFGDSGRMSACSRRAWVRYLTGSECENPFRPAPMPPGRVIETLIWILRNRPLAASQS